VVPSGDLRQAPGVAHWSLPLTPPDVPRRARQPWWIPPFLGRVPGDLEPRHLSLLGAVALALLIEEYDLAMLTAALPRIAADLRMAETDFGLYLGLIRLGALPAFLVIPFADRVGRRRVFLATLLFTGLFTWATGFSQSAWQFVALQMATRTFFITGSAVAIVIVAEEFPAARRGWGIGMLGALGACGHGVGMLFYSQVDWLPFGWRFLYGLGIIPVLCLPLFRRRVVETRRYNEHRAAQDAAGGLPSGFAAALRPLLEVAQAHPARALGIGLTAFLPAVGMISAYQFTGYYTQTVHGWSPGQYSAMVVLGGALGIIGNVAAGHLGDAIGRRRVGFLLLGSFPLWVWIFYNAPGWALPLAWIGIVFASSGGRVILRAIATELFPTRRRASASGLFSILDAVGAATGLFLVYAGSDQQGDFVFYTTALSFAVLGGGLILLLFPETRQRELEATSGEEGPSLAAELIAEAPVQRPEPPRPAPAPGSSPGGGAA
jgi:MFS family permease